MDAAAHESSSPVWEPAEEIGVLLADAECSQVDANRQAAVQATRMLRVIQHARRHPELYLDGIEDARAVEYAERAAVLDLALRMTMTEEQVRGQVFLAERAQTHLPALWEQAVTGFASLYLLGRAVHALGLVAAPGDATAAERTAERAAFHAIDAACAEWSVSCTPGTFNRRLKRLTDRLCPLSPEAGHARAMRDRTVYVEDAAGGMAWFHALMPSHEARAAFRRATSTAKHLTKDAREGRTRDQIRADLSSAWLRGVGTDTAVKTKVFVTIPVQLLTAARDRAPIDPETARVLAAEQAEIVGGDSIDPVTAAQIFTDTTAFHRVITDPIHGVILDMDRRTYRPTKAQRDWLILKHRTCARDGCNRLAADADIDHRRPWATGGTTNTTNLAPLCPRDHTHHHRTRTRYRSRPNGTIQTTTPTGHTTRQEPPPF
ncbi:HNH endonuclease signature motif containing protein [Microbacterium sp. NPDC056234]|uniref:HNH endonuclease signature motif containing protein n=1 Tax=Microbacterium sp. NPDC056234 TaxID=3345757 RepID=UPI0035E03D6A